MNAKTTQCAWFPFRRGWFRGVPCSKPAVVHEAGQDWCKIHAPSSKQKRDEESQRRWDETVRKRMEEHAKDAVAARIRDTAPDLLEALEGLLAEYESPLPDVAARFGKRAVARAAIAKARGRTP